MRFMNFEEITLCDLIQFIRRNLVILLQRLFYNVLVLRYCVLSSYSCWFGASIHPLQTLLFQQVFSSKFQLLSVLPKLKIRQLLRPLVMKQEFQLGIKLHLPSIWP